MNTIELVEEFHRTYDCVINEAASIDYIELKAKYGPNASREGHLPAVLDADNTGEVSGG